MGRKRSATTQLTRPVSKRTAKYARPQGVAHPPTLYATPKLRTKIRFQVAAGGAYSISQQNIADLLCFPTVAGVTAYRITQHFRIRSFELWSPPSSTGTPNTIYFQWTANASGISDESRVYTDTSLGQDRPAHIKAVPPKGTAHGNWQVASNVIVCDFNVLTGSIIDLDVEFSLADNFSVPQATSTVPTTGNVNVLCCKALEGVSYILPLGWQVA